MRPKRWDEDLARKFRKAGMSWCELGRQFGIDGETVRMRLDSEYREMKLARKRITRKNVSVYVGKGASTGMIKAGYGVSKDVVEARRSEIPDDTRDLTARIMGDPLPGRRALDRRTEWDQ